MFVTKQYIPRYLYIYIGLDELDDFMLSRDIEETIRNLPNRLSGYLFVSCLAILPTKTADYALGHFVVY